MREIKFILYTLAVAGNTSLWWATAVFGGIRVGPNALPLAPLFVLFGTLTIVVPAVVYCAEHWNDD